MSSEMSASETDAVYVDAQTPTADMPNRKLSMGARLAVVLGALMWVFAAGVFYTPLTITSDSGSKIGCGSAASPDTNPTIVGSCGPLPAQRRMQAIWILAGGVVVAIGGIAAFGLVDRRSPEFDSGL